jgi:hypothetical protein
MEEFQSQSFVLGVNVSGWQNKSDDELIECFLKGTHEMASNPRTSVRIPGIAPIVTEEVKADFEKMISFACECCGSSEAHLTCSQCMTANYCSPECQRLDWKNTHKKCCVCVKAIASEMKETIEKLNDYTGNYESNARAPCSTCHHTIAQLEHVIQCPCKHVHCLKCVIKGFKKGTIDFSCRVCKEKTGKTLIKQVQWATEAYLQQAEYYSTFDQSQAEAFTDLARMELHRLRKLVAITTEVENVFNYHLNFYYTRILILEKNYRKTMVICMKLVLTNKVLTWNFNDFEHRMVMGIALKGIEKYDYAMELLLSGCSLLHEENKNGKTTKYHYPMLLYHVIECSIKVKDTHLVFGYAMVALRLNKNLPGVLELLSKYYLQEKMKSDVAAAGGASRPDWDHAIQCLRAAVRYECPWRVEHKEMMAAKLALLIQEKEAKTIPSATESSTTETVEKTKSELFDSSLFLKS